MRANQILTTSLPSETAQALLLEGLDSGEAIEITRLFWKKLKAEAAGLLKKQAREKHTFTKQ